jgi:hypothetical protein
MIDTAKIRVIDRHGNEVAEYDLDLSRLKRVDIGFNLQFGTPEAARKCMDTIKFSIEKLRKK